MVRHGWFNVKS
jgi:hypothetical protein